MKYKQNIKILPIVLTFVFLCSCGQAIRQSNTNSNDKISKDKTISESPKSIKQDYQIGEDVAVIENKGLFSVEGKILESNKDGYKVRIGEGRGSRTDSLLPEQIFPLPWSKNRNLQVGDTVYELPFGKFERKKGEIIKISEARNPRYLVKFADRNSEKYLDNDKIFSSIEEADFENLAEGEIVYFNKVRWAIVIGKRDGKAVIRESGFPGEKIVEVSELEKVK